MKRPFASSLVASTLIVSAAMLHAAAQPPPPPKPAQPAATKPAPPRPAQPAATGETIAITGARIHPVSGPVIDKGTVVVSGGRILAVGANVQVPAGARSIDASGKVVTPGFLDSSTQVGIVEVQLSADGTNDQATTEKGLSAAFNVVDAFNPNSTVVPITRVEGVTRTVVMPAGTGSVLLGQAAVVDLSGAHVPASVHKTPAAMVALLGEAGAQVAGGSRVTAMLRLREALQDTLDYLANRVAYNTAQRREYTPSRLDLEALAPVVRGEVPLAIQANRASDLLAAMRLAEEFKLKLILVGVTEGWMVADEIARRKVPVVVKPLTDLPNFDSLGATLENPGRLAKAGVPIALASFETHRSGTLRQEAGNAVAYGMDRAAALSALTLGAARIWGVADRFGSIEPGKDADLVVWSGDPFELTTSAERVFIQGREMPRDTRQRQLLERYRDVKTMPRR
jgi:imidazolonepropionase-like amidohydrolase